MNSKMMIEKLKNILGWGRDNLPEVEMITSGDEQIPLSSDTSSVIRKSIFVMVIFFGGFLVWAYWAPLDEGATSSGNVTFDYHRRVVQHMNGGVVQEILIKEGQKVKEGEVLVRLVQTSIQSQALIYQQQSAQLNRQVASITPLVDEGYYPKLNYQELVRQRDEAVLKYKSAKEDLERTEIKSPISGTVMGLNISMGGVVTAGMKVLEVVPNDEGLVVEAKIMPQLIDRIHAGLDAQVRFSALNQRTTPIIHGKVEWVSADKFPNTDPNLSRQGMADGYYTAKIRLDPEELKKLGDQELYPGMPADIIIKTGSRNFMTYLLKPFTDRAAMSLKER